MRNKYVSVCLPVYNGELFLKQQLDSIVNQLVFGDELIIIDDCSSDGSMEIINNEGFSNTLLIKNSKNVGVNKSLEVAISFAKNDFIFLSDQDDIWIPNRLDLMLNALVDSGSMVLFSNNTAIDSSSNHIASPFIDLKARFSRNNIKNLFLIYLGKSGYYGCTSCFQRTINKLILPIPNHVESLDLWIAKVGILTSTITHLEDNTLRRRIHNNLSLQPRPLYKKILSRLIFTFSIMIIFKRILFTKRAVL